MGPGNDGPEPPASILRAIRHGVAAGACVVACRETGDLRWTITATDQRELAGWMLHHTPSPAFTKNMSGDKMTPSARARSKSAAWWRLGIRPPVPPLVRSCVHRRTQDRSIPSQLATTAVPPHREMISDAGAMSDLCDNRIGPVNMVVGPLGGFGKEHVLVQIPANYLEEFRLKLADELGKYDRSQSALARHLGLNQSAVSRMISGGRRIRLEEMKPIEEYLRTTHPDPAVRRGLPQPSLAGDAAPADAFPALTPFVIDPAALSEEDLRALVELDNDYPIVMTCASMMERALHGAFESLTQEHPNASPFVSTSARFDHVGKINALKDAGRIGEKIALSLLGAFAIRDVFAHSARALSLSMPEIFSVFEQIVQPGYFSEIEGSLDEPRSIRLSFLLTTAGLTHFLLTNDAQKTASILLDAAFANQKRDG